MLRADRLSRLLTPMQAPIIQLDVKVEHIQFSHQNMQQMQKATDADALLTMLRKVIMTGWPDRRQDLPSELRSYWNYRDELSVEDGVMWKGGLVPGTCQFMRDPDKAT